MKRKPKNLRTMPTKELLEFTATLSTRDWKKLTECDYAEIGLFIATDGCTGVPDFYLNCCILHDWFYRTHRDLYGRPATKAYADRIGMKECIRRCSWLGRFSPMAWWRWWGLRKWFKEKSEKSWG